MVTYIVLVYKSSLLNYKNLLIVALCIQINPNIKIHAGPVCCLCCYSVFKDRSRSANRQIVRYEFRSEANNLISDHPVVNQIVNRFLSFIQEFPP